MINFIEGDVLKTLPTLAAGRFRACMTSPPYWGLRDYVHGEQIGLESSPTLYVEKLVSVFREVRRVLADDGTLWLNLGDCYATGAGAVGNCPGGGKQGAKWVGDASRHRDDLRRPSAPVGPKTQPNRMPIEGLKPKDLIGLPWRVALALQADGWYLRSALPWVKRNCMPESVRDRPTSSVEYVFLLSKCEDYFYDSDAVKMPAAASSIARLAQNLDGQAGTDRAHAGRKRKPGFKPVIGKKIYPDRPNGGPAHKHGDDIAHDGWRNWRNSDPFFDSWQGLYHEGDGPLAFVVNLFPFREAHFATWPERLVEPMIRAGTAAGDEVLDVFGGSGTTGKVALELGRRATLCELNPDYLAIARRRCETTVGLGI